MKKSGTIKKSREYTLKQEEITSMAEEPAVKYKSLNVILGGKQSITQPVSGDFDLIALTREGIKKSSLKSLAAHIIIKIVGRSPGGYYGSDEPFVA